MAPVRSTRPGLFIAPGNLHGWRRLTRALAPLLLASSSAACADSLADELAESDEEIEIAGSEQALDDGTVLVTTPVLINTGAIAAPVTTTGSTVVNTGTLQVQNLDILKLPDGGLDLTQIGTLNGDGSVTPYVSPTQIVPKTPVVTGGGSFEISSPYATYGDLICSRTALNGCGTEKADYVGAYALDTTCDDGFFDMIHGGTCWKCPTNDGRGSDWIRTLSAVDKDDACHREGQSHATKVKSTIWPHECGGGSFWDGYDGGGCWTCPSDRPRRTAAHITAGNACAAYTLETAPARLVNYNGCPKPNATDMKLEGKRTPGHPFLDIAGGWNQGVAAGGCYACPVADKDGNILITERNASPIYGNNQGCDVLFKFKPKAFTDPGLGGMPGVAELLIESGLLESNRLTQELRLLAQGKGLTGTAATSWVAAQWQEIASAPFANASIRTLVFAQLVLAAKKAEHERSASERTALSSFESYLNARRVHLAQTGLAMYDAWKNQTDEAKAHMARSTLMVAFDYGTVPLKFHDTLATTMTLGAGATGILGSINSVMKLKDVAVNTTGQAARTASLYGISREGVLAPMKLLNGTATANAALAGTTIITVAFAIIQSVAIDQFVEIVTARPKLESALATAKQPVTLASLLATDGGSDQVLYWWSKALETSREVENTRVVSTLTTSYAQAQSAKFEVTSTAAADARLAPLDATFYLNKYPDLKAAFGSDLKKAQDHWLAYGIKEGRDASASFSIGAYLARYSDLQKAFGSDYEKALQHWLDYGKAEGRSTLAAGTYMADARATQLDPIFYANKYPDLKQAFGYKVPQLVKHWLDYGIGEKRLPNASAK